MDKRQRHPDKTVSIYQATPAPGWELAAEVPVLSAREVGTLVRRALIDAREGRAYGSKLVVSPVNEELHALIGRGGVADELDGERLNWKLSALIGISERFGSVKLVGSNAYNKLTGAPRSQSTILLFEKLSMRPICMLDGTHISAARTGAYASIITDLFRPGARNLRIFLLGAGAVARCAVLDLAAHIGSRIEKLHIRGRTLASSKHLIEECASLCEFPLQAENDLSAMRECDVVITATNAAQPVFKATDVGPRTVVAHFGGNETPVEFVRTVLARGTVICDDAVCVGRRNSQSLALYFSRQGRSLGEEARELGIVDIHPDMSLPLSARESPALVTCVGLPALDLYLAQHLYEQTREPSKADGQATA